VADDGSVDIAATEVLRAQLTAQRTDIALFNRGGSIDELKARCVDETHLPAPKSPSFRASA